MFLMIDPDSRVWMNQIYDSELREADLRALEERPLSVVAVEHPEGDAPRRPARPTARRHARRDVPPR